MSFVRKRRGVLLAGASGLVFAASTPPTDFQSGILLGLAGFALALKLPGPEDAKKVVRAGASRGFFFGLAANLVALRFVPEVLARFTPLPAVANWLALVLLSAAQALPWAIGGALAAWLARPKDGAQRPKVPGFLAFGAGLYAVTFVPAVFPWTPAGGLAHWPVLLQTAELVGERGTTFLVASACGLVADGIAQTSRGGARARARPLVFAAALFGLLAIYGTLRMRAVEAARAGAPRATVALLQPDFDATFRWEEHRATLMMDRLSALTKRAEESGAILTVWPESAYPYTLAHGVKSSPHGNRAVLQQGVRGPVLTGAYLTKGGGLGTNSAILVLPNGSIGPSYDKRHLLWFGETVPFADTFPILRQIFARGTGLAPGTESVALRTGPIVATVLNCYEDTLPQAGREAMEERPNLLVNVTNDAWFAGSAEGELHLRLAVLRSIEARRDLVRAVNRGPTSWGDAAGRVVARRDPTPGLGPSPPLLADVALLDAPVTPYTRYGDAPLAALLVATLALPALRRRSARSPDGRSAT
ncbi:MAG: apolipoprotein N-acyltransferase [Myxococcales bacterium]|nr:apolipoprotein N-acyltransferase [Myxococcales bacterium]